MAAGGFRPVVSIYSTFLQRAFDQIIHDVALQKLPVVLAIDRSGLVGEDGPTHHGSFDLSYLNLIPDLVIASPKNGQELRNLLYTATRQNEFPFVIRYPRDLAPDETDLNASFEKIDIGSWEVIHWGEKILLLAVGSMVQESIGTLSTLKKYKLNPTLVNCRFIKPIDGSLLSELLDTHQLVFTIEENSLQGGFGQKISSFVMSGGYARKISLHHQGLPDQFITHGERHLLLDQVGLSADQIAKWIVSALKGKKTDSKLPAEHSIIGSLISSL
jgi:1-deoxy-D-xylulose-5-phosphate synthase